MGKQRIKKRGDAHRGSCWLSGRGSNAQKSGGLLELNRQGLWTKILVKVVESDEGLNCCGQ